MRMIGLGVDPRYPTGLIFDIDDAATATIQSFVSNGWADEYTGQHPVHGGSSSSLTNWARIRLSHCPAFNAGDNYQFAPEDLTITGQAGSDFSVGADEFGGGVILTAAGGAFACGLYMGLPTLGGVVLDAGSPDPRFLCLYIVVGKPNGPFGDLGLDLCVPVTTNADDGGNVATTVSSVPNTALAGGLALSRIILAFAGGFGSDHIAVPTYGFSDLAIWNL